MSAGVKYFLYVHDIILHNPKVKFMNTEVKQKNTEAALHLRHKCCAWYVGCTFGTLHVQFCVLSFYTIIKFLKTEVQLHTLKSNEFYR